MLIFILAFFITPEAAPADRSVKVENAVGKAQERSLNDVQFSEIPSDTDLVTIANIAVANDDEVVLNAAKKLWQFRQMNSKLVKAEGFGTVVRGLWNRYGSRLQPLIKIAINALRGHVKNILSRHPTVKQYVQQLLCGY